MKEEIGSEDVEEEQKESTEEEKGVDAPRKTNDLLLRTKGGMWCLWCFRAQGCRKADLFRPLCLGLLDGGYIVASETCALDLIEAQYVRDIDPGEILIIGEDELKSIKPFSKHKNSFCLACFNGKHPIQPKEGISKLCLET